MEELDSRQRLAVHEAVEKIKSDAERETIVRHTEWIDNAIIPTLKEFAAFTFSVLEIERDDKGILVAILRNSYSISIMESCRSMYMALLMASYIAVEKDQNGNAVLSLTYDCQKFEN